MLDRIGCKICADLGCPFRSHRPRQIIEPLDPFRLLRSKKLTADLVLPRQERSSQTGNHGTTPPYGRELPPGRTRKGEVDSDSLFRVFRWIPWLISDPSGAAIGCCWTESAVRFVRILVARSVAIVLVKSSSRLIPFVFFARRSSRRTSYYPGKKDHHKRVTTERPHPTGGSCPREGHGKGKLIRILFSVYFGGFRG